MPIRRHHRWYWPIEVHELPAPICFRRASGQCGYLDPPNTLSSATVR